MRTSTPSPPVRVLETDADDAAVGAALRSALDEQPDVAGRRQWEPALAAEDVTAAGG
jgi:hypothetical protein